LESGPVPAAGVNDRGAGSDAKLGA